MRKVHFEVEQTQSWGRQTDRENERERWREREAIADADQLPVAGETSLACRWISQVAASVLSRLRICKYIFIHKSVLALETSGNNSRQALDKLELRLKCGKWPTRKAVH